MDVLSKRAQLLGSGESALLSTFMLVQNNTYDEQLNPTGICNCGVAENYLCEQELVSKLQSIQVWKGAHMYYPNPLGQMTLRKTLCHFFERVFHLKSPLNPERMLVSCGLSGVMSLVAYLLGDPKDVFLIASPYYTAFDHDISAFSNCSIYRCPLLEQDKGAFHLSVDIFREGYEQAMAKGLRPCGIILINPSNPLGDIYDEETYESILKFAAERNLHAIFDEIYALSTFENQPKFSSILNSQSIIDPARTHFVWSFSKDFALSGLRLGVFYAGSPELASAAANVNFIQVPSIIVQETVSAVLTDDQWIDMYLKLNRSRLTKRYEQVKKQIEQLDSRIRIRPGRAGFFLWTDFRSILHSTTFEEENRLYKIIFSQGVYITSGYNLGCSEPGWFRIIFSVKENWIDTAIKRLHIALQIYEALID